MRNTTHEIQVQNMKIDKVNRKLTQNSIKGNGEGDVRNTLRNRKRLTWIREKKTNLKDIIHVIKQQKWR